MKTTTATLLFLLATACGSEPEPDGPPGFCYHLAVSEDGVRQAPQTVWRPCEDDSAPGYCETRILDGRETRLLGDPGVESEGECYAD